MEGGLLDPETSDTLAKEWTLPELPEGNSSHPSSSQELAEIFGTSDDEDIDDFPFDLTSNLNLGKTSFTDIDMPVVATPDSKKFDSSLLSEQDSNIFLNSIQESLSMEDLAAPEKRLTPTKDDSGSRGRVKREIAVSDEGVKVELDDKKTTEVVAEGGSMQLRKSTRLTRRRIEVERELEEEVARKKKESKPPEEETKKSESVEEKDSKPDHEDKPDEVDEMPPGGEEEGEEEEGSGGESGDDEDEESDDPDRLWCICKQPHNDRFMICCDHCEEWYHGDCVGITVAHGKRMEREGKEYVCPICTEKERREKEMREAGRSARQARREMAKEKKLVPSQPELQPQSPTVTTPTKTPPSKEGKPSRKRIASSSSHTPTSDKDQYGLMQLFLPDNAPPRSVSTSSEGEEKIKVKEEPEPTTAQCIGPKCSNPATPPSIYCSDTCIERHAVDRLKRLSDRGISVHATPSEFVRGSGGVPVTEKSTGKTLVGIAAPSEKNLVQWLKAHPSYQVLLTAGKGPTKMKKPKSELKKDPESPSKLKLPTLMDAPTVRANAKKALYQILLKRCEGAPDLTVTQEEVEKIAHEIEEKLFNLYQDITPKYKNKYRSLLFNLKDLKNQGLFRKVLIREVTPRELVRMRSDKLASEELAQWREKTIKKNLEMIKVAEEEAQAQGGVIRKKTYKGDVEIDTSAKTDRIETIVPSEKPADSSSTPPSETPTVATKSHSDSTDTKSHSKSQGPAVPPSKAVDSAAKGGITEFLNILTNTTEQHDSHVYDHHCDICNGKIPAPTQSQVTSTDTSPPSPDSRTVDSEFSTTPQYSSTDIVQTQTEMPRMLWRGVVNMTGLANFAATAYSVSGVTQYLPEILPETLQVMGRIAHVQVWDYMDKLRSSSTRDIVVIRFDRMFEDQDAYMTMHSYLVRKHRCGVINCCYHGIKDFYLVPLLAGDEVAPQLLPFSGPGLPNHHPDLLLGVIVRSKTRRRPSSKSSSSQSQKRHHSSSEEQMESQTKRIRVEVGIGNQTPPTLDETATREDEGENTSPEMNTPAVSSGSTVIPGLDLAEDTPSSDTGGEAPMEIEPQENHGGSSQNVQLSFYGQHQPLPQAQTQAQAVSSTAAGGGLSTTASSTQVSGIQSILSQLSDERLKELASAMSSISQTTPTLPVAMATQPPTSASASSLEQPHSTTPTKTTPAVPSIQTQPATKSYTQPQNFPQQPAYKGGDYYGGPASSNQQYHQQGTPPSLQDTYSDAPNPSFQPPSGYSDYSMSTYQQPTPPQGPYQYGGSPRYEHPPPQAWEHDRYYGKERYDSHYGDQYQEVSKLDRIESRDYGHKSGPPRAQHDWKRHEQYRYEHRDRPRR